MKTQNNTEDETIGLLQNPAVKKSLLATGIASAMLMPGNMMAEEVAKPTEPSADLDGSTVYAEGEANKLYVPSLSSPRYTLPILQIPRSISVIPKELIQQQNAATVIDAVRNIPGIALEAGEGGATGGDNLSIRGFEATEDFFVDGIRDIGGYTRDAFNYEQVEVTKGPSSTDSGRGSTGGSINLVTKKANLEQGGSVTSSVGTDNYQRHAFDYNHLLSETSAFRLNLMNHDADTPGRDNVNASRWGIAGSLGFGIGTDFEATFNYMHQTEDNVPDYGIPFVLDTATGANTLIPDVDQSNYYGLLFRDYEDIKTDLFTAEYKYKVSDDLQLRSISRYGRTKRDSVYTAPRMDEITGEVVRDSEKGRYQTNEIWSTVFDVNYHFQTGRVSHDLVAGADFTIEKQNRKRPEDLNDDDAPSTDLSDPNPYDYYVTDFVNTADLNSEIQTFGVFVYDTVKLNDQWTLNGGLRFDSIRGTYNGVDDGEEISEESSDDVINVRAALNYSPSDNGTIYLSYGTSTNPSAEDFTYDETEAAVDPEKTASFELGTKWSLLDDQLGLTAAAFYIKKTDKRERNDDREYFNTGEEVVKGFELGATGQITEQLSAYAGYTYLDSEITKAEDLDELGLVLGDTPKHSASVWLNYDLNDDLAFSGGARYVGDLDGEYRDDMQKDIDGFVTVDLAASYQLTKDLRVQVNAYNIFDKEYVDQNSGGHYIPGAGRSATVSLNYTF